MLMMMPPVVPPSTMPISLAVLRWSTGGGGAGGGGGGGGRRVSENKGRSSKAMNWPVSAGAMTGNGGIMDAKSDFCAEGRSQWVFFSSPSGVNHSQANTPARARLIRTSRGKT